MGGASRVRVVSLAAALEPPPAQGGSDVILDVAGEELVSGSVVTIPLPESGDEVRGYVVACEDNTGDVFVMVTAAPHRGQRLRVHGSSCSLQHAQSGKALMAIQRAGNELGLVEVEAA